MWRCPLASLQRLPRVPLRPPARRFAFQDARLRDEAAETGADAVRIAGPPLDRADREVNPRTLLIVAHERPVQARPATAPATGTDWANSFSDRVTPNLAAAVRISMAIVR